MGNFLAKIFGINKDKQLLKPKSPGNFNDSEVFSFDSEDLPAGAEYVDEDCEGCECDGGGDCGGD